MTGVSIARTAAVAVLLQLLACSTDRPTSNLAGSGGRGGGGSGGGPSAGAGGGTPPGGSSSTAAGQPGATFDAAPPSGGRDAGAGGLGSEAGAASSVDGGPPDGGFGVAEGGVDGGEPGELRFVPPTLTVSNLSGEESGFNVVASTLVVGPDGPALHAALRNDRDVTACDAAVSFELFDDAGQSVGAWIAGLQSRQLFRRGDGEGGLIACVEPGVTAMVTLADLPDDLAIEALATAIYQLTYFDRDILPFELVPVEGLSVEDVEAVPGDAGFVFTGTLRNDLDVPLQGASVTIFPVSGVGRPLAAVSTRSTADVAPGESWTFETTGFEEAGVAFEAFPRATVAF